MRALEISDNVIEKAVLLIPEALVSSPRPGHGGSDGKKVLEELCRQILIHRTFQRQFDRHCHQVQCVHCHPGGPVRLIDGASIRHLLGPVERANIVQAEETSPEQVPFAIIPAIDPPCEVQAELVQHALEKIEVSAPLAAFAFGRPAKQPTHARED
ncbi:hypothetical protein FFM53_029135 (plasmid) [Rhizobium indicum]|uniref:Uncharacterized protein n=1 Tax=Rhizobium indicum TaxID=2583231 RepID=A0ABX6PP59_9HYPH|nr:hypothetical protein [Rhizobium indicum]QKK20455.1 hypothetical protein FFM53_029135 [Rhizobium indicum]